MEARAMATITALDASQTLLRRLLSECGHMTGFTGAGISTECGVPDFRSPDSPWARHTPIDFADFLSCPTIRAEAWRRKFAIDDMHAGAKPGRGHRALASLVASGRMRTVITQNIDGLHQASGLDGEQVIELHGNGTYAACLGCQRRYELVDIRERFIASGLAPDCACGAPIKSATISFGQAMPREAMRKAQQAALACDLFLAIGSSLVVHPAATLPVLAKERGATLVIINREPTAVDPVADFTLRGDIGDILEPFA
jgi:NAD-dependent deacetylase